MNNFELYFLRSSERFIVKDLLCNLLDPKDPQFALYHEHYGDKVGDMGVYILYQGEVVGGAWTRLLEDGQGFIQSQTPELKIVVKPKFYREGYATYLMEQLLYEVSGLYKQISLTVELQNENALALFKKFGFEEFSSTQEYIIMLKKFDEKESKERNTEKKLPKNYDNYLANSYF